MMWQHGPYIFSIMTTESPWSLIDSIESSLVVYRAELIDRRLSVSPIIQVLVPLSVDIDPPLRFLPLHFLRLLVLRR